MNDRNEVLKLIKEEGNEHVFINAKSGYDCILKRNLQTGAWCGYVVLPNDHPFFGMDRDDLPVSISVHGGLTFSNGGVFGFDCGHVWDYYPITLDLVSSFVTEIVDIHDGEGLEPERIYRTKEYVIDETNKMAEQFYEHRNWVKQDEK